MDLLLLLLLPLFYFSLYTLTFLRSASSTSSAHQLYPLQARKPLFVFNLLLHSQTVQYLYIHIPCACTRKEKKRVNTTQIIRHMRIFVVESIILNTHLVLKTTHTKSTLLNCICNHNYKI